MYRPPIDPEHVFVARELGRLPAPRAPHTLLPRVMAAVHRWARRPWYTREWLAWPLGWQIASLAAWLLLIGGAGVLFPHADAIRTSLLAWPPLVEAAHDLHALTAAAGAAAAAVGTLWRALVQPFVTYAFAIVMVLCFACAAFASALGRVAFGRALQS